VNPLVEEWIQSGDPDLARLFWLVEEIEDSLLGTHAFCPSSADQLETFTTCVSLVRLAVAHLTAMGVLLETDLTPQVTGPLRRTIYEIWLDFSHLLAGGDRDKNAAKLQINSLLELTWCMDKAGDAFADDMRECVKGSLDYHRDRRADAHSEVVEQRKGRKYHWSGLSRTKLESLHGAENVYTILSWDAHATTAGVRGSQIVEEGGSYSITFDDDDDDASTRKDAWSASGFVYYMYARFAEEFGFPSIVPPDMQEFADDSPE
jgi:hypothetical protein